MDILFGIVGLVFLLWVLGFSLSVGGSLIHLLLVVAVVVLAFRLIRGAL